VKPDTEGTSKSFSVSSSNKYSRIIGTRAESMYLHISITDI